MPINFIAVAAAPVTVVHHWDAVTAWSTIALAIVTAIMAGVTAWMAVNTQRALTQNNQLRNDANLHYQQTRTQDQEHHEQTRKQEQQHHEDSFRPVLILAPPAGVGAAVRGNLISGESQTTPAQVYVHCPVQNIGVGLALNIRMFVRKDEQTGFGPSIELTPIAAGDRLEPLNNRFALPIFANNFNNADLNTLKSGPWVIVLEYEDVFGNPFHTLHYKNAQQPWARTGRGPAPDTTPTIAG